MARLGPRAVIRLLAGQCLTVLPVAVVVQKTPTPRVAVVQRMPTSFEVGGVAGMIPKTPTRRAVVKQTDRRSVFFAAI